MTQSTFTPQVEIVKVDDLAPYEQNPRIIPDAAVEAVADSIKEFGFLQPIVIDDDGSIAAGHTRLQAAKRLGLLEVPIIRAGHLTPDQIRAYRLSDNRTGEYSGWHMDALAREVVLLEDAPLPGFQDDELAALRGMVAHLDGVPMALVEETDWPVREALDHPLGIMRFIVSEQQRELIERTLRAVQSAKQVDDDPDNENSNGNALAGICRAFLARSNCD